MGLFACHAHGTSHIRPTGINYYEDRGCSNASSYPIIRGFRASKLVFATAERLIKICLGGHHITLLLESSRTPLGEPTPRDVTEVKLWTGDIVLHQGQCNVTSKRIVQYPLHSHHGSTACLDALPAYGINSSFTFRLTQPIFLSKDRLQKHVAYPCPFYQFCFRLPRR